MITVRYTSLDRVNDRRTFKTLAGARAYAERRVGQTPEIGRYYAVSFDGVGKIEVQGCTLADLFPCSAAEADEMREVEEAMEAQARLERSERDANAAAYLAAAKPFERFRAPGCTCSERQLDLVGCDCGAEDAPPAPKDDMTARRAGRGYDVFSLSPADLKRFPDARKIGHLTLDGRFGSDDEDLVGYVKAASVMLGVTRVSSIRQMLAAVRLGWENQHKAWAAEAKAEQWAENAWLRAAEAPTNDDLGFYEWEARRLGGL